MDHLAAVYEDAQGTEDGPETGSLDCGEDCAICPWQSDCQDEEDAAE